ncbi:MAG: hypothetical protein H7Y38_13975, partial [Armatimonadetes bacterium]|nr:hypothetical protein [Armatimonadota bacterium]
KAAQARRPKTELTTEQIADLKENGGELKVVFSDAGSSAPEINSREIYARFECRS